MIQTKAITSYSVSLGTRMEQNSYTAELAAIAAALKCVPSWTRNRQVTILSSNQSALAAIRRPLQQPGQSMIQEIYDLVILSQEAGEPGQYGLGSKTVRICVGNEGESGGSESNDRGM
jgi:hypothetical protein